MLEKLIVDRYIDIAAIPQSINAGPEVNGFQEYTPTYIHLAESEYLKSFSQTTQLPNNASLATRFAKQVTTNVHKVKDHMTPNRTSALAGGAHASKTHRNLVWLPYVPGKVTEVRATGLEVLTGPLSGCWVTRHIRNGVTYVGHVGTENNGDSANSLASKASWNAFAQTAGPHEYSGFNALRHWAGPMPRKSGDGSDYLMGLVTGTEFYAVLAWKDLRFPTRLRIAAIQRMTNMMPPSGQVT